MNWQQHITAAEKMLEDAEQSLAVAITHDELLHIHLTIEMAHAHAMLAEAKKVST